MIDAEPKAATMDRRPDRSLGLGTAPPVCSSLCGRRCGAGAWIGHPDSIAKADGPWRNRGGHPTPKPASATAQRGDQVLKPRSCETRPIDAANPSGAGTASPIHFEISVLPTWTPPTTSVK